MRSRLQNFFLIIMLGLLNALTPFSIDMYLPSFPQIAQHFNTTVERVAFSVSTYFFGFALGQILYGPLLDHFGRKRPLYVGLAIYVVASIGCAQSSSLEMFFLFRFLQALGGSVGSVGAMAMVRDFFPVDQSAKIFSLLMLVLSVSPLLAPSVGSLIVLWTSWRMIFWALGAIAALNILMAHFFLPESHTRDPDSTLKFSAILNNFKEIFLVPSFRIYVLAGSFSFAGLFVYVAGSPAIFMGAFHVSAQVYGIIFGALAVGMIGGGQVNLLLTRVFKSKDIFKWTLLLQVLISAVFLAGSWSGSLGLYSTIAILFIILASSGITYPNAAAVALRPFSKNAGTAAALLGFLQLGIGSLISASVGMFDVTGSLPTAAVMSVSSIIALGILLSGQNSLAQETDVA